MPEGIEEPELIEPETPEVETPETPEVPETPAFDIDAERARIREQVEAEFAQRNTPVKTEEPDIDELQYADPAAYRKALTEQIRGQIMGEVSPLLNRLNQDVVTSELAEGLTGAGRDYARKFAANIPLQGLTPEVKELIRNAAENVERKAQPVVVNAERPYGERGIGGITPQERFMYNIDKPGGLSTAEYLALKKETGGK